MLIAMSGETQHLKRNLASHIATVCVNTVETKAGSINIVVCISTKRSTHVLLHNIPVLLNVCTRISCMPGCMHKVVRL